MLFVGYDKSKRLTMSIEARRCYVHVDDAQQRVELRFEEGLLREKGGESPLPGSGYRLHLDGVQPKDALDAMLGMVVRR